MIGKVASTGNFGATFRYALRGQSQTKATIIGGNLGQIGTVASDLSQEELAQHHAQVCEDFQFQRAIAPASSRATTECNHWVVAYSPGEHPSDELARVHAESFIAGMVLLGENPELAKRPHDFQEAREQFKKERLNNFQFAVIRHHDKDHAHSHIVMGRRDLKTGKALSNYYSQRRAHLTCEALEREFDLVKLRRGKTSNTEREYLSLSGQVLEPTIRQMWAASGQSKTFDLVLDIDPLNKDDGEPFQHIVGESFRFKYYAATNNQPERISIYKGDKKAGKTRPLASVYLDDEPRDKTMHNNALSLQQATELRDYWAQQSTRGKDSNKGLGAVRSQQQHVFERTQDRQKSRGMER